MVRFWQSIFLTGLLFFTALLIFLLYSPSPGLRNENIGISTSLNENKNAANVAKLKIGLNEQGELNKLPRQIRDWHFTGNDDMEGLKDYLKAEVLLMRTYRRTFSSRPMFLVIVHAKSTGSIHPPDVCYGSGGYLIELRDLDSIAIKDASLKQRFEDYTPDSLGEWAASKLELPLYPEEILVNKLIVNKVNMNGTQIRRVSFHIYLRDLGVINCRPSAIMGHQRSH